MTTTPGEVLIQRLRPLLLPGLVLLLGGLLLWWARRSMEDAPRFVVDPSAHVVLEQPSWVSDELAARLAGELSRSLGEPASLLVDADLRRWREQLAALSPWVESVDGIEPRFPRQADLALRLRRPVLLVDGSILVAASGHVLGPGPVAVTPEPLRYEGAHAEEDYRECAAAAGELLPFRAELELLDVRVVSVDVADGSVVFRTDSGVELDWGRSHRKSDLAYLDLPPVARIDNLREVLVNSPGLAGVAWARLWTDRPVVRPRAR